MTPAQFFAIESEIQQNKMQQVQAFGNQVGTGIRRAATAAAGFAAGGAGGAQMAMGGGSGGGDDIFSSIAGMYMEQENMKSSVKAGNLLLKVLGPGIGMTEEMLKEMDLANKPMREQYAFQQGILGNYAVASQARNFGQTQQAQQGKPFLDAAITNLNNTAAGNVPFTPPASQDPANTVPLPTGPGAVVAPPSGGTGRSPLIADMNDADYARYRQDVIDRTGRDPGPR